MSEVTAVVEKNVVVVVPYKGKLELVSGLEGIVTTIPGKIGVFTSKEKAKVFIEGYEAAQKLSTPAPSQVG